MTEQGREGKHHMHHVDRKELLRKEKGAGD